MGVNKCADNSAEDRAILAATYYPSDPVYDSAGNQIVNCDVSRNRVKESQAARMVKVGGMISTVKKIITKSGKPMLFMGLEDLTDRIEVVVFASTMEKNPAVFCESKVVYVYGRIDLRDGETKLVADNVEQVSREETLLA